MRLFSSRLSSTIVRGTTMMRGIPHSAYLSPCHHAFLTSLPEDQVRHGRAAPFGMTWEGLLFNEQFGVKPYEQLQQA
jgi:hypothetical protein